MKEATNVVSVEFDVVKRINQSVQGIIKAETLVLPGADSPLTLDYIRRIEGRYDVARSRLDTDNAIDLLYIAYNTTPQKYGSIRNDVEKLIMMVLAAQASSENKMTYIMRESATLTEKLRNRFEDWASKRGSADAAVLKVFLDKKLLRLVSEIKQKAETISKELGNIVSQYDDIVALTTATIAKSQTALSDEIKISEEIAQDIATKTAEKARIDSLVRSLESDITEYQALADGFQRRAETAEQRAFIMSVVQVGAQMVSAMAPAIVAGLTGAATGGVSLVATAACGTASNLLNSGKTATESASAADELRTKKEISEKSSEKSVAEAEKAELEAQATALKAEKKKIEDDADADEASRAVRIGAIDKRIQDKESAIQEKDKKIAAAAAALEALAAAAKVLDEKMGKMAEKQEQAATGLREMQMKMLEHVREYNKEKHKQDAELAQITVLLRTFDMKQDSARLSVQSLNLSLAALNKMREIILGIQGFFSSFAAFMASVMAESDVQADMLEEALSDDEFDDPDFVSRIARRNDAFFVTQVAEWQAINNVSARFEENFNEGKRKLNALKGDYLYGTALEAYLRTAADKIDEIVATRKQAAQERELALNAYKDEISQSRSGT
ncbi:tyrosyl-tRNA deacylase [Pantoea ananatis]|uniref:tyrosyl-tRNA deacylase n=1 Tax=Pantoea ananas TaxID=553 RepID=UPI001EE5CBB3|nr:tyrosyl-tRNA deacylase [Pantoea ananatis]PKC45539.1 tyrosyl-tRNA deacylase [Pantoea ananatis BRT98]